MVVIVIPQDILLSTMGYGQGLVWGMANGPLFRVWIVVGCRLRFRMWDVGCGWCGGCGVRPSVVTATPRSDRVAFLLTSHPASVS